MAPHSASGSLLKRKVDSDLRNQLRNAVELVSSDAAADERRASKVLKWGIGPGHGPFSDKTPEFVNLIIHNLDKAHSARRITSRLWKADPFSFRVRGCLGPWQNFDMSADPALRDLRSPLRKACKVSDG